MPQVKQVLKMVQWNRGTRGSLYHNDNGSKTLCGMDIPSDHDVGFSEKASVRRREIPVSEINRGRWCCRCFFAWKAQQGR